MVFLVGHRTLSPGVASQYAAAGVAYFELDARVADGRVIVTHYRPVVWARGALERNNTRLRVRGRPPLDLSAEEVIAGLPEGARILFDPKDREPELRTRLVTKLGALIDDPGRHVVSTRSLRDLEMFAAAGFRTWWTLDAPQQLREVSSHVLPADGVTVRQRSLTADSVRALHGVTDTVVAWTARTVTRAQELVTIGVDGITTHNLDVMASVPH